MPRSRGRSNRPHPSTPLASALGVAEAIAETNASRPMNRLLLAEAMGHKPGSSTFRDRIAAATKYGLTEGNYNSETISLTPLAVAITRPRDEAECMEAKRSAFRTVPIFDDIVQHFANAKLPEPDFLKNILEREPFNVHPDWSISVAQFFTEDAREVGYLRNISGSPNIVLDASGTMPSEIERLDERGSMVNGAHQDQDVSTPLEMPSTVGFPDDTPQPSQERSHQPVPMQIFIAHGSKRKPLEQLKEILNSCKVPFLVAVDEANAGRPISEKVADTMRQCTAGIFIFTADEHFLNEAGETVFRPSQNVVYELGAASLLYGRKIVILKEADVTFPSDFSDLGWIEFDENALGAKGMDLLREMIALDAVKLVSAGSA